MMKLAVAHHPDRGGTQDQMARINAAYEKARS
jgi:curved DNA-binding protein CbpA